MGAWELPNSKSPALYAPPDMNSEYLLRTHKNIGSTTLNPVNPGIVSGQYPLEEGPLSQMSEAVSKLFQELCFGKYELSKISGEQLGQVG